VEADVEIKPETLNLSSHGRWVMAFIELPEDYHAADIDPDSVMLNGVVPAEKSRIGDHDRDGVFELMVKFDRRHTASLLEPGDAVEIAVTGLVEGLRFGGVDAIRVISRGKGAGKGKGRSGRGRPDFTDFGPRETTVGSFSIYFYHLNHLGTPRAMTDENGNVVWKADYKPFGEAEVAGDAENRFRFPGQYRDEETGLHYNWHRYYDLGMGRYVTGDPIGLEGGINIYSYCEGNPIFQTDIMGLQVYTLITAHRALRNGRVNLLKEAHYNRLKMNEEPTNKAERENWILLGLAKSYFHMWKGNNKKYVSPGGRFEAVYNEEDQLVVYP